MSALQQTTQSKIRLYYKQTEGRCFRHLPSFLHEQFFYNKHNCPDAPNNRGRFFTISFLWCMQDLSMSVLCMSVCMPVCISCLHVRMNVAFECRFCMSDECRVCMSSKKYPLRGCDSEWGKQPYGVLSPSPNLPLKERWGSFARCDGRPEALPLDSASL